MSRLGLELLASLEQDFAKSKILNFKGTARVRLSQLLFSNPIRPIDPKIVRDLKRDFKAEGCLQHETECSVPAILNETSLALALEGLNISAEGFKNASISSPARLQLPSNVQLECLHGQHRIRAATEYLPPGERWWLVDIYGQGLNERARQMFREGHSYSTNYTDGDIFRQIRLSQFNGDRVGEDRWRARITSNKEKDLRKLLKRGQLISALDSILPMRGLWNDFHFGSMDIFLLRFDEEIAHYIYLIGNTFNRILGDQRSLLQYVDQYTVETVQLRAPGVSKMDSEFLRQKMLSRELFPEIQDLTIRAGIEQSLLKEELLIPSLYTLVKDLRYLEPAAKAVKALLPEPKEGTLRQSLRFLLPPLDTAQKCLEIQDSEISYSTVSGDFNKLFDLAYRQLFLCAWRYFTSPSNFSSKKNMNPIKQTVNATKRFLGFKLIELGHRLGFLIKNIDGVLENPSERLLADLLRSLPKEIFKFNGEISESLSVSFKKYLANSTITTDSQQMPPITTVGLGEPLSRRCGRSCGKLLEEDKDEDEDDNLHLFLRKMHAPLSDFPSGGYDISSFYVKRSIYLAFFGTAEIPCTVEPPRTHDTTHADPNTSHEPNNSNENLRQDARDPQRAAGVQEESAEPTTNHEPHSQNPGLSADQFLAAPQLISHQQEHGNPELLVYFVSEDGTVRAQVPFTRESVGKEAKNFAVQGFSLMDERGIYQIWYSCYNVLVDTETRRIIVVGTIPDQSIENIPPGMYKRRGLRLLGNRVSESDLPHKARHQQATVEEEEEEEL